MISVTAADDHNPNFEQLQTEWPQFSTRDKIQCNGETSAGSAVSYAEFLTCLEMEREAKFEREGQTSK